VKNFIQPGDVYNYANSSGSTITSGSPVLIGSSVGVAARDIPNNESGPVNMSGVYLLAKVGSQAWAQGDLVFWDHTNSRFTKTASSDADVAAGEAFEVAGSGAGVVTGYVKLIPGMGRKGVAVATIATADGSDAATTQALANANKAAFNLLLTSLRNAGLIDS
jgi:predicted RecA/RadA family phage recombinase